MYILSKPDNTFSTIPKCHLGFKNPGLGVKYAGC